MQCIWQTLRSGTTGLTDKKKQIKDLLLQQVTFTVLLSRKLIYVQFTGSVTLAGWKCSFKYLNAVLHSFGSKKLLSIILSHSSLNSGVR